MTFISGRFYALTFLCFTVVLVGWTAPARASADSAQFAPSSNTEAPDQTSSAGIKLKAGISNVLFKTYESDPDIGPMFITNAGPYNYFIPQKTLGEFKAFIAAARGTPPLTGITINAAVKPAPPHTVMPVAAGPGCGGGSALSGWNPASIVLPFPRNAELNKIIVNRYTLATPSAIAAPTALENKMTIGTLDMTSTLKSVNILSPNPTSNLCGDVTFTKVYRVSAPFQSSGTYATSGLANLNWSATVTQEEKLFAAADGAGPVEATDICTVPDELKKWGCHMDGRYQQYVAATQTYIDRDYNYTTYSWTCEAGCRAACPDYYGGTGYGLHNRYCVSR